MGGRTLREFAVRKWHLNRDLKELRSVAHGYWGWRMVLGRGHSWCKGTGAGPHLHIGGTVSRPLWLELRKVPVSTFQRNTLKVGVGRRQGRSGRVLWPEGGLRFLLPGR